MLNTDRLIIFNTDSIGLYGHSASMLNTDRLNMFNTDTIGLQGHSASMLNIFLRTTSVCFGVG